MWVCVHVHTGAHEHCTHLCVCVCVCVSVCVYRYLWKPEEGIKASRAEITVDCKSPYVGTKPQSSDRVVTAFKFSHYKVC